MRRPAPGVSLRPCSLPEHRVLVQPQLLCLGWPPGTHGSQRRARRRRPGAGGGGGPRAAWAPERAIDECHGSPGVDRHVPHRRRSTPTTKRPVDQRHRGPGVDRHVSHSRSHRVRLSAPLGRHTHVRRALARPPRLPSPGRPAPLARDRTPPRHPRCQPRLLEAPLRACPRLHQQRRVVAAEGVRCLHRPGPGRDGSRGRCPFGRCRAGGAGPSPARRRRRGLVEEPQRVLLELLERRSRCIEPA